MSSDGLLARGHGVPAAIAAWLAMTAVMMTPAVVPWVRVYATLLAPTAAAERRTTPAAAGVRSSAGHAWTFAAGYGVVLTLFSAAMAGVQVTLAAGAWLVGDRVSSGLGAGILIAAGIFQFTPLKASCLTHCRNPLSFFLARWKNGPVAGFRLGLSHGAYCLGCCWALMLTAFAVGVMNLAWMALLTVVVVAEQATLRGPAISRAVGIALVAAGVWRLT